MYIAVSPRRPINDDEDKANRILLNILPLNLNH